MTNKISRRELLKVGLAGALTLTTGGIYYFTKPTLANKLLEDFPNEIPGAREVKKYEIRNAAKTLVHVKQAHQIYPINENLKRIVSQSQRDIYSILSYLQDNNGLREVYVEGNTPESQKLKNQLGLNKILTEFDDEKSIELQSKVWDLEHEVSPLTVNYNVPKGMTHKEYIEKCRKELEETKKELGEYKEFNKYYPCAAKILEREGKIITIPAESEIGQLVGYEKNPSEEDIYDQREYIALDIISRNQNPLNVLVYGAGHWFGDNINKWNEQHKDKKYSLIEVTPESFKK